MRFKKLLVFSAFLLLASPALALSPTGTPEYKAEIDAINKMRQYYPAYRVMTNDVNMRSNRLSITIPTVNGGNRRVNFTAYVRKVTNRDGTYKYEVDRPNFN